MNQDQDQQREGNEASKKFRLLNLRKLKVTRSESIQELERRSQLVRSKGNGIPPPSPPPSASSPPSSTHTVDINAIARYSSQSTKSLSSHSLDMERAFSDSVAITDDGHSHEDLLEQLRQMMSLNSMLSEQLTVCEGQLSLYKDRLMEVNRRNPVAAAPWTRRDSISSTHSVDGFDGIDGINGIDRLSALGGLSGLGSLGSLSGPSSRSATPLPDAQADSGISPSPSPSPVPVDTAALRAALAASNVVMMPSSTISLHKTLGKGCFGETVLGRFDGIMCAVKKVYIDKPNVEKQFVREVEALQTVRHPHVLSLWGAVVEPDACWLVTEYMPAGTLNDALRRSFVLKSKPLSCRLQILWDVASGMAAMERIGVLHRDLKPSDVLLDGSLRAKVADLGLARIVNDDHVSLTAETGTYIYMAPEVMNWESYGSAADVWSFVAKEVMQKKMRPDLPDCASARMKELLLDCLAYEPAERPSFSRITKEMQAMFAEQKAKEGVEMGLKRSSSWKNFFGRESGSGRLGSLGRSSSIRMSTSPGSLPADYNI